MSLNTLFHFKKLDEGMIGGDFGSPEDIASGNASGAITYKGPDVLGVDDERKKELETLVAQKARDRADTAIDKYLQKKSKDPNKLSRAEISKILKFFSSYTGIAEQYFLKPIADVLTNPREVEVNELQEMSLNEMGVGNIDAPNADFLHYSRNPQTQAYIRDLEHGLTNSGIALGHRGRVGDVQYSPDEIIDMVISDKLKHSVTGNSSQAAAAMHRAMLSAVANADKMEKEDPSTFDGLQKLIKHSFMQDDVATITDDGDRNKIKNTVDAISGHEYMVKQTLAALQQHSDSIPAGIKSHEDSNPGFGA
ncbi:TPA: hypothetical protein ACN32D_002131 [Vibrio parahaemolyticus]|uniref:hypothetical protein n=1 Tax=Vibrio parahaemolyticus TaxID=670 RepID=UPI000415AF15|nr:hypothetical protein [Vibrio parahaemolyticus]KIT46433.1 hypothetical protein H337_06970 [Vibrio parahaemolyticus EN9701121]EGQ7915150.1 hypothetical protein [Vibrio parahaemolyticus]EGQ9863082.1 hypothetical protein [Vibrio parahaemolyticus]EGW0142865.1 hypothetical protein [Vibrio parahaemolyticus]EHB9909291.1 hypothetical protein [Vibrio parahaemolyticus]